ncbi:MAG: 16S rRNA (cytosine(1402)-N(4))-methyltransferase RsmH [Rickettsiales bacterium]|jgi:16S rRNA (cytosine1402-N4)-methyltransferase|nr:16S rRNA (cytosine(1402)-N(4))-methyltransferase RsmH [Rickettsiales bacterium]
MIHIPVLLNEVLNILGEIKGKTIIDATFGAGGYSRAFLERGAKVIAFDRDPNVAPLGSQSFELIRKPFSEIDSAAVQPDAVVFDLGVSSMQLDNAERGFSYKQDGALDMRMSCSGRTAADAVNCLPRDDLIKVMKNFGEEPKAKFIADEIVKSRPINTTGELRAIIERASFDPKSVMRVFQAFRILINDEMVEIEDGIKKAADMLSPGGILVIVSFHSLEDRVVKGFMRQLTETKGDPKMPVVDTPKFAAITRSAIQPTEEEIVENPRARSARLRAIRKL